MKTPARFFRQEKKYPLFEEIREKEESIEQEVEKIQKKLMINESDYFDDTVKINVNLFEGYNTDELCKTFEDINKYNSKLTETELLACRLHNICNFTINDKPSILFLKSVAPNAICISSDAAKLSSILNYHSKHFFIRLVIIKF